MDLPAVVSEEVSQVFGYKDLVIPSEKPVNASADRNRAIPSPCVWLLYPAAPTPGYRKAGHSGRTQSGRMSAAEQGGRMSAQRPYRITAPLSTRAMLTLCPNA